MSKICTRLLLLQQHLPKLDESLSHNDLYERALTSSEIFELLKLNGSCSKRSLNRSLESAVQESLTLVTRITPVTSDGKPIEGTKGWKYYIKTTDGHKTFGPITGIKGAEKEVTSFPINKQHQHQLTDAEVNARVIDNVGALAVRPSKKIVHLISKIKYSIKHQYQLRFDYKNESDSIENNLQVNPIGVINNAGRYSLIASTTNPANPEVKYFNLLNVDEFDSCSDKKVFCAFSAQEISGILSNEIGYRVFSPIKEKVKFKVKSAALEFFASNELLHATETDENFITWLNDTKTEAEVCFLHPINLNFLRFILSYGSTIEVIENDNVKRALEVQRSCDPSQYNNEMAKIFPDAFPDHRQVA